jgi:hypothetical protein
MFLSTERTLQLGVVHEQSLKWQIPLLTSTYAFNFYVPILSALALALAAAAQCKHFLNGILPFGKSMFLLPAACYMIVHIYHMKYKNL